MSTPRTYKVMIKTTAHRLPANPSGGTNYAPGEPVLLNITVVEFDTVEEAELAVVKCNCMVDTLALGLNWS